MRGYFKIALKVLTRRKFFTFISLFGISLTLVVLVVAAAMLDDMFSPHEPQSLFDRVLTVQRVVMTGPIGVESTNPGYGFVHDHVLDLPGIERSAVYTDLVSTAIYRNGARIEARLKRADANYWKILQYRFLEGRPFTAEEERRGDAVAVITSAMRQSLFNGESALGRTFELDGQHFRVVGVVPPVPITRTAGYAEMWTPITTIKGDWRHGFIGQFTALVLARSRADFPRLKQEYATRVRAIPLPDPKNFKVLESTLDTPFESVAREIVSGPLRAFKSRPVMVLRLILTVIAVLFMTLPALNLVTLNLSRILERASEIGVRKAFGAPRGALISQFVLENVVLTLLGGLIALALAAGALVLINRSGLIPDADLALNPRVFAYGLLIAVFFGIFSGAYPAWRMSRLNAVDALRGGAQ
jgi:putative ABC transport system permease protein